MKRMWARHGRRVAAIFALSLPAPAFALCPSGSCAIPITTLPAPTTAWQTLTYDLTCTNAATFVVNLVQGQSYTFTLCGSSCPTANAPFDSRIELYQGATLVATSTAACTDDGEVVYQTDPLTGAGAYCVRVVPEVGTGTFTLGYRVTCQPPSNVLVTPDVGGTAVESCGIDQLFSVNTAGTGAFTYDWSITPVPGNSAVPATRLITQTASSDQMISSLSGLGDYSVDVTVNNDCGSITESIVFTLEDNVGPSVIGGATPCGPIAPPRAPVFVDHSAAVHTSAHTDTLVDAAPFTEPDTTDKEQAPQPIWTVDTAPGSVAPPGTRALSCPTPCSIGTLQATTPFYDVFLSCTNGIYTARTGASHSVTALGGGVQNVIFGGSTGSPGTSDLTLRVHNNNTSYLNPTGGRGCLFDPPDTATERNSLGAEMEWSINPVVAGLSPLVLREEIVAFGVTEADSGIRMTLSVTNPATSTTTANVGFRWQIDYQNAADDGPGFAPVTCRPFVIEPERFTEHELLPSEVSDFYRIQNNTGTPIFGNFTSTAPMSGFPDTATPDRLIYGLWSPMRGSAWNYQANEGANADFDSATLVYFGYLPVDGLLVAPGETVRRSVVIFTAANTQSCGAFTPGSGVNAEVDVCRDDCADLSAAATDNCSVASVAVIGGSPGAPTCNSNPCNVTFPVPGDYTYTWEATDGSGNTTQAETTVHVFDLPQPALSLPPVICLGDSVTLDASGSSATCSAALEYEFRDGATVLSPWSTATTYGPITPAASATLTVDVRCPDGPGCSAETTASVTVAPPPTAVAGPDVVVCEGDQVLLDASASADLGCPAGLQYEWRDGATIVRPANSDPTWTPTATSGTATYTVVVSCVGLTQCVASDDVTVSFIPSPSANAGPDSLVCLGESVVLDGTQSVDLGCPAGLLYEWRDGATVVRPASPSPTWTPPTTAAGTTTYTLVVSCAGLNSCPATDTVVVEVVAPPVADAGVDVAVCSGVAVTVDGSQSTDLGCPAGLLYEWRDGATVVRPANPSPTWTPPTTAAGTTTYTLVVSCAGLSSCPATDTVVVEVVAPPVADAGADVAVCSGVAVILDGSQSTDLGCPAGLLYEWRQGATVVRPASTVPTWTPPTATVATTTYTLVVTCAGLPTCSTTDPLVVDVQLCNLAVVFDAVAAVRRGSSVDVTWRTLLEEGSVAFVVERAPSASAAYVDVALLAAEGPGWDYAWSDTDVTDDQRPWYRVVEYTIDGRGDVSEPFRPGTSQPGGRDRGAMTGGRR